MKDINRTKNEEKIDCVRRHGDSCRCRTFCIKVSKESVVSNELFEENVEALTRIENDYQKKEWIVYEHGNGDFNCTKGGTRSC